MERYKKLTEMPHINYGKNVFDLEIESFRSVHDFIEYLEDILDGEIKVDKYGNEINLKDRKNKIAFIKGITENEMFQKYIQLKMSDTEKRLLRIMLKI